MNNKLLFAFLKTQKQDMLFSLFVEIKLVNITSNLDLAAVGFL